MFNVTGLGCLILLPGPHFCKEMQKNMVSDKCHKLQDLKVEIGPRQHSVPVIFLAFISKCVSKIFVIF